MCTRDHFSHTGPRQHRILFTAKVLFAEMAGVCAAYCCRSFVMEMSEAIPFCKSHYLLTCLLKTYICLALQVLYHLLIEVTHSVRRRQQSWFSISVSVRLWLNPDTDSVICTRLSSYYLLVVCRCSKTRVVLHKKNQKSYWLRIDHKGYYDVQLLSVDIASDS